ncbi:MAG TPA: glycosyltransferase [Planctomycetota bacterium]|nr:glycosyltransferase [Planctomycetota bacterium]
MSVAADGATPAPVIDILLATFDGAAFLAEQLDSLARQSYPRWRLLVADDGSRDGTLALLRAYAAADPRIEILDNPRPGRGAAANFAFLIGRSRAPYAMCCDQDDVWDADKVALSLARIRQVERRVGTRTPVLVHSDVRVVDQRLAITDPSGWDVHRIRPDPRRPLRRVLGHNDGVTGCALIANRALIDAARPVPDGAFMHDWWLLLVATAFGVRALLPRATLAYRQHGRNAIGAKRVDAAYLRRVVARAGDLLGKQVVQAEAFLGRYGDRLAGRDRRDVVAFIALARLGPIARRLAIVRHGFWKNHLLRDLGLLLLA